MHTLIGGWLNGQEEQLTLFENDDEINFRRVSNKLLIEVQLTKAGADNASLRTWMRLGGPSLSYFHGALAQSPLTGALWLVQCVEMGHGEQPVKCLESLLNQRDTWRAIVARQARPARAFVPTSLRSIPH
ncbi:type III secretion protein [Pseudomonas synxantha]|uniref:type III secretion system chaperone n=1 Tax=Pseudomonas TaxID=286 RepID=UPI000D3838C4|nr:MULTISPECIES: type III secretion system chaperone [Pseudomonas]MDT3232607.1 type III secretion system chaperone [Pseudomonas sp. rhizo25]WDG43270.1 type III secretion protein [Pseudomonas synxantha]